jgi:ech hydrogenase subunit F
MNMTLGALGKTAIKNLFSKPATSMYPHTPANYKGKTRGRVLNEIDVCIFCGACQKKCPTGAIKVNRAESTWTIDRLKCIACAYCVDFCPKKCLEMGKVYAEPTTQQEEVTLQGARVSDNSENH